jgi:MYXO-CTERM domain-containing protein
LDVTDVLAKGDRFEIFDFGSSVGLTSLVATASGGETDPDAAFNDPTYSSGRFTLADGSHSITIFAVENPYGGGSGVLRASVVPEPSTLIIWSLLGALGIAVGWWRRRRRAA